MKLLAIQPACCQDTKSTILIEGSTTGQLSCPSCGKVIGDLIQNAGLIYVLSSTAFPNTYKIGFTLRDINERLDELNGATSLPFPFVIEMMFISSSPIKDEAEIHKHLKSHRVNEKREFFRLPLIDIHKQIATLLQRNSCYLSQSLEQQIATHRNELRIPKILKIYQTSVITDVPTPPALKKIQSASRSRRFGLLP